MCVPPGLVVGVEFGTVDPDVCTLVLVVLCGTVLPSVPMVVLVVLVDDDVDVDVDVDVDDDDGTVVPSFSIVVLVVLDPGAWLPGSAAGSMRSRRRGPSRLGAFGSVAANATLRMPGTLHAADVAAAAVPPTTAARRTNPRRDMVGRGGRGGSERASRSSVMACSR
jgi:hypothetical protein